MERRQVWRCRSLVLKPSAVPAQQAGLAEAEHRLSGAPNRTEQSCTGGLMRCETKALKSRMHASIQKKKNSFILDLYYPTQEQKGLQLIMHVVGKRS